ncbi:MAG: ABC transporter ATP-binding protein [Ruminococcaceae bacterium]|nr:ABC transporter ATP-binding protein [Oscillospiraceae bacterium]
MNKKQSKFGPVLKFLPKALPWFVITVLSSAMITVLDSITPQLVRMTVDSIIGDSKPDVPKIVMWVVEKLGGIEKIKENMYLIAITVVAFAFGSALMRYISRASGAKGSEIYTETMRNSLFSHIQKLPYKWHVANQTGDIIQRCTSDVNTVKTFISGQLPDVFRLVFLIGFSSYMMFTMNWKIALLAISFVPFVFLYSMLFNKKIHKEFGKADEAEGELSTIAQENITGVRIVRAFGREAYEKDKFEKQNNIYTESWVVLGKTMGWFWGISDFVSGFQMLSVIVFGIFCAASGDLTEGEFIAFVSYNGMLTWPVRQLGRLVSQLSRASVSAERIAYILNEEEEKDMPHEVDMPDGDIVFDNVTFSYSPELQPVLKNISFTIKKGEMFAILGGTGSGKSTLVLLLHRLYDLDENCGTITIGGVDIRNIKRSSLRSKIGMILQEPFLFSKTIGENIAITEKSADNSEEINEKIRYAASLASISDEIEAFADKYDTVVGERGVTLSGGQKQRVAIARQFVRENEYIVLDDSLSAVDTETDSKIRSAIVRESKNSTVIIISHRVTTLSQANKILVLENGRVSEYGTPAELLNNGKTYSKIYELQTCVPDSEINLKGSECNE